MTQLDFGDYASQPASRTGDPFTAGLAGVAGNRRRSKRAVLAALAALGPATDEMVADHLPHLPRGSAARRRLDLVRLGLVEQVLLHGQPVTKATAAGRQPALVWTLTRLGRQVVGRMEDDGTPPPPPSPTVTVPVADIHHALTLIPDDEGHGALAELIGGWLRGTETPGTQGPPETGQDEAAVRDRPRPGPGSVPG